MLNHLTGPVITNFKNRYHIKFCSHLTLILTLNKKIDSEVRGTKGSQITDVPKVRVLGICFPARGSVGRWRKEPGGRSQPISVLPGREERNLSPSPLLLHPGHAVSGFLCLHVLPPVIYCLHTGWKASKTHWPLAQTSQTVSQISTFPLFKSGLSDSL